MVLASGNSTFLDARNSDMAIDATKENVIPFNAARAHIPGRRPNLSTLHRWRLHGVRGRKLETLLIGGRRFTSEEAIQRFVRPEADPADTAASAVPPEVQARADRAQAELARFGV
jgi:hypothetical protein